jgi:hypothetical protein
MIFSENRFPLFGIMRCGICPHATRPCAARNSAGAAAVRCRESPALSSYEQVGAYERGD